MFSFGLNHRSVLLTLQIVRCDGKEILEYLPRIKQVLSYTLHIKCKDGSLLACKFSRFTRNFAEGLSMIATLGFV